MSRTLLIECSPRQPADGTVVARRLVYKAKGPANYLGVQWEPVVDVPPTFESSIGFDGRQFGASPAPQAGQLEFVLNDRTRAAASLVWKNAVITIKSAPWPVGGGNPADGSFSTVWTGLADDIAAGQGRARVTMLDGGQLLRTPLAVTKFGASGDALLDSADAVKDKPSGTVVPLAFGRLLSIEGKLVDRANNIWLFAGRPATAVAGFYDGGAAFTTGAARASLAALQANIPAAGAVDYCLDASGKFLARPWDVPTYPLTADASFGSARAADIASTIVALRAGPAFTAGTVAAFNALQPADCGLYVDDDSATGSVLDRLFLGLGAIWRLNSAGTIDLRRLDWGTPALTVPAHRRGAPERLRTIVPTARRSLGYARNNRVHSEGDIAAILLAEDLRYANGTPVEALKPADAGATFNAAGDFANRNGSFEFDANPDGSIPGWSIESGHVGTLTVSDYPAGSTRGRRVGGLTGPQAIYGEQFPVSAGEKLWARTRYGVNTPLSTAAIYAVLRCYDATEAVISPDLTVDINDRARATFYTTGVQALTVPAGALTAQLIFGVDLSFTTLNGSYIEIDYYEVARTQFGADKTSDNTAAAIAGQAWAATNGTEARVDNLRVGVGSNDAVNSDFTRGSYGFRFSATTSSGPVLSLAGGVNLNATYSGIKNVMWASVSTSGSPWHAAGYADAFYSVGRWNAGTMADQREFGLPVKQNDTVYARCLLARYRCITVLYLLVFDKDGTLVEAPSWEGGRLNGAVGGDPANMEVVGNTYTITHADAASAMLMWRMVSTSEADPYIFMTEPAFGVLPTGQTVLPPYQPGRTDPVADRTADQQITVTIPSRVDYAADYLGTLAGSLTTESIRVSRGGASIKGDDDVSYAITASGGVSGATVDNSNGSSTKGDITLAGFTGNSGAIDVVVTVGGVAQPRQTMQFVKTNAPPPLAGGAGSKIDGTSSFNPCALTSDVVLTAALTVTIASGESLYGAAPLDYEIDGTTAATRTASLKWQYDAGGGTWTDFVAGTYVTGSSASSGRYVTYDGFREWNDPIAGSVVASQSKSGLAAGDYPVRLVGKLSATGRTATFYGTATIEAKV